METSHSLSDTDFKPQAYRRSLGDQQNRLSAQDGQQTNQPVRPKLSKYNFVSFDSAFFISLLMVSLMLAVRYFMARNSPSPLSPTGIVTGFVITASFVVGAALLDSRFRMPRAALLLRGCALFTMGAMGSGILGAAFFDVGHEIPFKDATLLATDQMLGFDWLSYAKFIDAHAWLNALLSPAYHSIGWQPVAILLILAYRLDCKAVYAFLTVEMLGFVAASLLATFVPSVGVAQFFGLVLTDHPHMVIDQGSSLTAAVLSRPFASFHALSAVLYIWAWWRVPIARYYGLALNVAMLFATPLHGSDYLVDVIAGGLIAASLLSMVSPMLGLVTERPAPRALARKSRLHRCIPAMS